MLSIREYSAREGLTHCNKAVIISACLRSRAQMRLSFSLRLSSRVINALNTITAAVKSVSVDRQQVSKGKGITSNERVNGTESIQSVHDFLCRPKNIASSLSDGI